MIPALSCVALLPAAGYAYQCYASRRDEKKFPPAGELIDVGGYQLHVLCQGEARPGVPTVIFESGIWGCSLDWQLVQPEIAQCTQTVSYDRAGYGWSEKGPCPRTFHQMASELKALLTKKGIQPPFIFVSHSLGGGISRYYQTQYPNEVAGFVLVDTVHEDDPPQFSRTFRVVTSALRCMSYFGALRCMSKIIPSYSDNPAWTPSMQKTYLAAHHMKPKSLSTCFDEWDGFDESFRMLRESKKPLRERPVIVLTPGNEKPIRPGLSKEENEKAFQEKMAIQKKLLKESDRSELRIAANSSHMIQFDRPELIIDAIRDILQFT